MRMLLIALAALALSAAAADKKKPPDVQVLEVAIIREGDIVTLDARVRATGAKPLENLKLAFDFIGSGKKVLASRSIEIDERVLEPGEESVVQAETSYPPLTIQVKLRALLPGARELDIANAGPFPIQAVR